MFEPSLVVQSAASSFNNIAISAPSFFWGALLMLPLFVLVYRFGNDFINGIKWSGLSNPKTRTANFALCIKGVILAWLILMHGNYAVLRDVASVLPYLIAGVLFVTTAAFVRNFRAVNPILPVWYQNLKYRKLVSLFIFACIIVLIGVSGYPAWWGFVMQVAAVICGALVGRAGKKGISPILLTSLIMFFLITVVLMQPEFFRFGQLGNLTVLHMVAVMVTGMLAMAVIVVRNIKPHDRIYHSAFVKLKLMTRIVAALCLILFILTESVPVFLGFAAVLVVQFTMSVWHEQSLPDALSKKLWSLLICCFGIMLSLPVITALGIVYWTSLPKSSLWKQAKFLL